MAVLELRPEPGRDQHNKKSRCVTVSVCHGVSRCTPRNYILGLFRAPYACPTAMARPLEQLRPCPTLRLGSARLTVTGVATRRDLSTAARRLA